MISLNDHNSDNEHEVQMFHMNQPKRKRPRNSALYTLKRNPRRKVYIDQSVIGSGEHEPNLESIDINALDDGNQAEFRRAGSSESQFGSDKHVSGFDFSNLIKENRSGHAENQQMLENVASREMGRNRDMLTGKLVENVSDDEDGSQKSKRGEWSDQRKSKRKSKGEDGKEEERIDAELEEELMDENVEFKNEKDLIEFVFGFLEECRREKMRKGEEENEKKGDQTKGDKETCSGQSERIEKESEMKILDENKEEKTREEKPKDEKLNCENQTSKNGEKVGENEETKIFPKSPKNGASTSDKKNNQESTCQLNPNEKIEPSTTDEGINSETSKMVPLPDNHPKQSLSEMQTNSLQEILNNHSEKFKNSVLNYMILNPESRANQASLNPQSMVSGLAQYDQYLMNDNMEFLSVVLSLLYAHKGAKSLQDPLIRIVLKLLVKRLLNTTDNYIQCEKSFSMIVSKFTKNVRERFNDLKSYLLNQKLKNMSDLKIKTSTLVKKMNMTLDSVGGKNSLVSSAISRRQEQIEGFVGNYIEREGYSQLNMAKILREPKSHEVPQLKGEFSF